MPNAGLTPTQQSPLSALASLEVASAPVSELWEQLFDHQPVREAFIRAVRRFADGRTVPECYEALEDRDVPYWLRSRIIDVARGNRREAWRLAADLVPNLGQGHSSLEDLFATADFFAVHVPNEQPPTLAITIDRAFEQAPRRKRETVCRLLAILATGFDVRIVASGRTHHWLAREHREDLPVSAERNTPRVDGSPADVADQAIGELDPDGREVGEVLRPLVDEPTETRSYHSLYAAATAHKSRIRQCISRLTELGLVATFGSRSDRNVELLEAGREYLSRISRQMTLESSVSQPPKSHTQTRGTRDTGVGGDDAGLYRTTVQNRADHAAVTACAADSDVCLVQEPRSRDETPSHRRTKHVYYNEDREQVTVSVHAGGGLPYLVSIATALSQPWFLETALPNDRLEALDESPAILRGARNIGGLSETTLNDPEKLRKTLADWGENLEELTTELSRATGEDKSTLGAEIMRSSHGLAGSIIHLLDATGIDVVREVRIPSGRESADLEGLVESITRSALIQSKYGVFAPYRHILETDAGTPSISPEVDAADPHGELIGSFVLRGADIHRIRHPLEMRLSSPGDILEDAPEIAIPITITDVGRPEITTATARILESKNLRPTREAVSVLHALTGSPFDIAHALNQLGSEGTPREIRADELRYALSALEADQITPELPPTVGKVVSTLLRTDDRLSQRGLADRAGVSTQSLRNNRDVLKALGLVSVDGNGWRLQLSFRTTGERRAGIVPDAAGGTFVDAVSELLETMLPPERYGNPKDQVGGTLFWPPNPWILLDHPDVAPWVKLAARLTGTERPDRETTIAVGPPICQQSITAPTETTG
ncbi:hypothetical protein [Natronococcus wangiae]|uniref:hypothetical protein n=1 Tax=Natronococcus wangiae TaxID=3068275 RepID=UPI00273D1CC7|nr:hypothetical protein [Natronococcus sp. AD5]